MLDSNYDYRGVYDLCANEDSAKKDNKLMKDCICFEKVTPYDQSTPVTVRRLLR